MTRLLSHFAVPILALLATSGFAQRPLTTNTLSLDSPSTTPRATMDDVAWLVGRWRGTGFGGEVEETWGPALGGTMIGTFRLVRGGKPDFYELLVLEPAGGSLTYKVKHFHADLRGWEAKDACVSFPLVRIRKNEICFHGLTLRREGDACVHYLAMRQKDGKQREVSLRYVRAGGSAPPAEPAAARAASIEGLAPLLGTWSPEADKEHIVHDYSWTVGRQALRLREGYRAGRPEAAQLDGLVFLDPANGTIRFVAVAGHGKGQGRVFDGTYTVHGDGRIERTYRVTYRTLADVPGEQLGGMTRRYREVYTLAGNRLSATLEWWRDGRWQPFGRGTYALERRRS
ncbi:MAG: hypothetical protein H6837_08980 [Planctomycetes bacterium]|nr:hypothetical protein [Planctomycetota bacterium]